RSYGDWSSDVCSSDLITVLPDEQNRGVRLRRIGRARHDGGRAGMTDQLELTGRAIGESHRVDVEPHHAARVHATAIELHGDAQWLKSQVTGTLRPSARK